MDRSFTYEIFKQECVGDSLGKHNFNILSLDSGICNLSSKFLTTTDNNIPLMQTFYDLSANINIYNNNLPQMLNPLRFTRTYAGLNLLSAYWIRQELTIEYEFNRSTIGNLPQDIFLFNTNTRTFISELSSLTYNYITFNYPTSNFLRNAIMNVVVPIYANDGSLTKTYSYTNLSGISIVTSALPVYENIPTSRRFEEYRYIKGVFEKKDDNFAATPLLRFINTGNTWTFVNLTCAACLPTEQISTVTSSLSNRSGFITVNRSNANTRVSGPCSPISFAYLYKKNIYYYASATVTGKLPTRYRRESGGYSVDWFEGGKIGTISLYFYNPNIPSSETVPYASITPNSAQGYHSATLEWTSTSVNAYETSDLGTRLVNTWPIPYGADPSISFGFTKDENGINYTACASKILYPPSI